MITEHDGRDMDTAEKAVRDVIDRLRTVNLIEE